MEFRIGDKVRFVTTEPQLDAWYYNGELEVYYIAEDGALGVDYPDHPEWPNGLTQIIHPDDVEHV